MKKTSLILIAVLLLIVCVGPVSAQVLSIEPAFQSIGLGGTALVNVNISGLGNFMPDTLGAFDMTVNYDSTVLSLDGLMITTLLGDPSLFEASTSIGLGSGFFFIDHVSLLSTAQLDALQPSAFTLFTVGFKGESIGASAIQLSGITLVDAEFPAEEIVDFEVQSARINVNQNVVPEPTSLILFGSGMLGAFIRRKK